MPWCRLREPPRRQKHRTGSADKGGADWHITRCDRRCSYDGAGHLAVVFSLRAPTGVGEQQDTDGKRSADDPGKGLRSLAHSFRRKKAQSSVESTADQVGRLRSKAQLVVVFFAEHNCDRVRPELFHRLPDASAAPRVAPGTMNGLSSREPASYPRDSINCPGIEMFKFVTRVYVTDLLRAVVGETYGPRFENGSDA